MVTFRKHNKTTGKTNCGSLAESWQTTPTCCIEWLSEFVPTTLLPGHQQFCAWWRNGKCFLRIYILCNWHLPVYKWLLQDYQIIAQNGYSNICGTSSCTGVRIHHTLNSNHLLSLVKDQSMVKPIDSILPTGILHFISHFHYLHTAHV